jgi:hypothetical protein
MNERYNSPIRPASRKQGNLNADSKKNIDLGRGKFTNCIMKVARRSAVIIPDAAVCILHHKAIAKRLHSEKEH